MNAYSVQVTEAALAAISAQVQYIAEEANAPLNAQRWLERVWDAIESLEQAPRRAQHAEEDAFVEVEVRHFVVGSHLLLFTIDDAARTVTIVGLRHGHRLPRPEEADPD